MAESPAHLITILVRCGWSLREADTESELTQFTSELSLMPPEHSPLKRGGPCKSYLLHVPENALKEGVEVLTPCDKELDAFVSGMCKDPSLTDSNNIERDIALGQAVAVRVQRRLRELRTTLASMWLTEFLRDTDLIESLDAHDPELMGRFRTAVSSALDHKKTRN